ncbi:acetate/propionate family kinase [Acuticoccus mangrovi]|uniref:Acetate kinase n=1 Tax=Acuticoccus mangrovi TaxID=2796142 RepID=A0A934IIX0_9HYPH|nr:acetate/propionate family kinase [Acuticoccus mangrovi]
MSDILITFNAGSSTVKLGLFETAPLRRIAKGMIDFRRRPLTFHLIEGPETFDVSLHNEPGEDLSGVMEEAFTWLANHFDMGRIAVAGHRVVHGGDHFAGPVVIDDTTLSEIEALTPLAPLHQPGALRLIRAIRTMRPHLPQTASFDTAFHRTNVDAVRRFAIPRALHDEGIKRYGFHGLSYAFIAAELARRDPALAKGRVVAAHLGSGASLCAMENGVSRDTSMGFSALDGVPMATRCGAIDPAVILHLLGPLQKTTEEVTHLLYYDSGLLGMSGISADTRDLLASDAPAAAEALEVFTRRIAGEVARLAATLGGLDALVFTAGIGEHQPEIRSAVIERLGFLGLQLDASANAANAPIITAADSPATGLVIPTNEELIIAEETLGATGKAMA